MFHYKWIKTNVFHLTHRIFEMKTAGWFSNAVKSWFQIKEVGYETQLVGCNSYNTGGSSRIFLLQAKW
jgi:hypothetical protein